MQQMNNRYIFRGKRKDNGEWIYGGIYYQKKDDVKDEAIYIIGGSLNDVGCAYEVIPETVGQCTNLKDKNGKLIFEGDIVKDTQSGICYFIKWFSECACYSLANKDGEMNFGCDELEMFLDDLEVIGNIHDNDLLEVER